MYGKHGIIGGKITLSFGEKISELTIKDSSWEDEDLMIVLSSKTDLKFPEELEKAEKVIMDFQFHMEADIAPGFYREKGAIVGIERQMGYYYRFCGEGPSLKEIIKMFFKIRDRKIQPRESGRCLVDA